MATYGEMIYMALDLLKEQVDDAYYTEEHMLFLLGKARAHLLESKYRGGRNTAFTPMSDENKQRICIPLEKTDVLPGGCGGDWLKSKPKIPGTLGTSEPKISAPNDILFSSVCWIPVERMPYVGYNKWLKHILYAAKSDDGYLYITGWNSHFVHLQSVVMDGVFSDPQAASELACEGEGVECDIMSQEFPLEASLITRCIEMVVQEVAGPRYAPEDKGNNASDDLSSVGLASGRTTMPAEQQARARARQAPEQE